MDGLELIHRLRQQPTLKNKVIIVSSASTFEEDRRQSLAAGSDDFLSKPVKTEALLEMLRRHLGLEWAYAEEKGQDDGMGALRPPALSAANIPAPEKVAHLYQLAMMGHAAALQEKAVELTQSDEQLAPFAAEVERLAKRLQINEMCEFLERYLER
jgi:DNA-binding response OmpR family regulator